MALTNLAEEAAAYNLDGNLHGSSYGTLNQPGSTPKSELHTTHHYAFKEYGQLMQLIADLPRNVKKMRDCEMACQKFLLIIDEYQEQPHLIDPHLTEIFDKLVAYVQENAKKPENAALIHEAFKYMYSVTKMRGYKKIVQHLPHEVTDFELVLGLLGAQDMRDVFTWQTRYMLLIWLSIVCMIPFDLHKFDLTDESQKNTIMNRVIDVCMPYLFSSDKCQDSSAYVFAKFMSRPDLKEVVLPNFFEQLFCYLQENKKSENHTKLLGILKCIANIYKHGKREDLLQYTLPTLKHLIELDLLTTSSLSLIRKFHIKIIQRIGVTFFKAKIAKWRYQRGSRVLMEKINKMQVDDKGAAKQVSEEEEDEMIPNEVEDIVDQLLIGLKDQETIVRWSAAKGIGRITNRFSKEMASDVLASILDLFTFVEDVFAWHGGCLAIAELGRRGLLLPDQLSTVIPIVLNALVFDKKIGNFSFGSNVRDSACYVCWALARAFEPDVLKPHVNQIASTLLIATVFDREVNCRRGASAAFQENVGRQGQFPHGIDILTKCDYYAVSQLQNCYLHLSKFIADYDEYRRPIIDHLLEYKFNHWDQAVRELTSKALFNLTECCPDYMATVIVPELLKHSFSIDLNTRHGALLSLGEIIHALCDQARNKEMPICTYFTTEIFAELQVVINKIFDSKYFRGSGGEYMRPSVCFFIKKLAISKLFFDQTQVKLEESFIKECDIFIRECIEYSKEGVQLAACETIPFFCEFVFASNKSTGNENIQKLINSYISCMKATSKEFIRSGYCLALGNMPSYVFKRDQNFINVCRSLIEGSKQISGPIGSEPVIKIDKAKNPIQFQNEQAGWVSARRDSIRALQNLFKIVRNHQDLGAFGITEEILREVIACFFHGLSDYSLDSKGDSGSKVRETSIQALEFLINLCGEYKIDYIVTDREILTQVFGSIMQQAVERIDRTRSIAGGSFVRLLHSQHLKLEFLSYTDILRSVFTKQRCHNIDWNLAHVSLPLFMQLITVKELRLYILTGVVYSIGSLTESLVKPATKTFLDELKVLKKSKKEDFKECIEILLHLCKNHLKNDRLATSLIKTVDLVVQNDLLCDEHITQAHIPVEFLNLFMENVRVTKDMTKLHAYVDLFCDMLQFEEDRIRERSMIQLMVLLCHQYPRVRKSTASKLFEALINYTDEMFDAEEDYDECVQLLTDTLWDQAVVTIRPIRNRICDLTKTPKPVLVDKTKQNPPATQSSA